MPGEIVFLCHNSGDKPAIEHIAGSLLAAGIKPWLDVWNLVPGEEFGQEIEDAMRECTAVAVFIGPTGRSPWQNHEVNRALNSSVKNGTRLIPVILPDATEELAGDFLKDLTWVKFRSLDDVEALRRLVCGIRGESPGPSPMVATEPDARFGEGCPYAGLISYDLRNWPYFVGRESATDRAIEKIEATLDRPGGIHFLAILGISGSGKSSFARAGLVHTLLARHQGWLYLAFEPSDDPLRRMAGEFTRLGLQPGDWSSGKMPGGSRLIVLVDQFEEVFTRCTDEKARETFISNLTEAASNESARCVVIVTLRMDFYEKCARFPTLASIISDHQIVLGPMDVPGLQAAIERPARREHWDVEPALVSSLISDCGSDPPLPLLQMVLKQLWKKGLASRKLTLAAYQSMTLKGAINELADEFFKPLSKEDQETALSLFSKLAQPNGGQGYLRRRLPLDQLMPTDAAQAKRTESLIGRLAGPDLRLLTIRFDGGQVVLEVAHEDIFSCWSELQSRLGKEARFFEWRQRIEADVHAWQQEADGRYCISGGRLKEAVRNMTLRPGDLTRAEKEYIGHCKRRRNRRLAATAGITALALLAGAGSLGILISRVDVNNMVAAARTLTDRGNSLGLVLAYEASRIAPGTETETLLQETVQTFSDPLLEWMSDTTQNNGFTDVAMSGDGHSVAVAGLGGEVVVWEAKTWGPNLQQPILLQVAKPSARVVLSFDGRVVAAGSGGAGGEIRVWETVSKVEAFPVTAPGAPVTALAITPDGSVIAAATEDSRILWWRKTPRQGDAGRLAVASPARDLAFKPDGSAIAAAAGDTTARVFELSTGKMSARVEHHGVTNYVAFDSSGEVLASGGRLAEAQVWNTRSGERKTFELAGWPVLSTAFSGDGRRLATLNSDQSISVGDAISGRQLWRFRLPDAADKIVISSDGKRLAGLVKQTAGLDGQPRVGKVRIYELDVTELRRRALSAIGLLGQIDCGGYAPAKSACEKIRQEAMSQ